MTTKTSFYTSSDTKGGITLMLWPTGMSGGMSATVCLTPADALRLAKELQATVDKMPRDEAENWLASDGYDEAVAIAAEDHEAAREYAAELRADR